MKNELTETLLRAIQSYAEYYLVEHDESDLYDRLSGLFNLSDADLDAIGLAWVIPKSNEPEPNEPPKKTFTVRIVEHWAGTFEIEAKDEDEAYDLACDLDYNSDELGLEDRDIYVYDDPAAAEM